MLWAWCVQEIHFGFERLSKAEYSAIEGQLLFIPFVAVVLLHVSPILTINSDSSHEIEFLYSQSDEARCQLLTLP